MTDLLRCHAEAIAWPLVSLAAFRRASPQIEWQELFPSFRLRLQQLGFGRAEESGQWAWREQSFLFSHLQRHAEERLYDNSSCMRLRPDHTSPGREILAWRWLSLALPPLVLTSAAMPPGVPAPPRIQVLDPALIPRGPVAHLHLHIGAAYPFEFVWSHMASTARFDRVSTPPVDMHDVHEWRGWLTRALLVRRILAAHVRHRSALARCAVCLSDPHVRHALGELTRGHQDGHKEFREARLRRWACQVHLQRRRPLRQVEDIWYNDPLGGDGRLPEAAFMASSLAYLTQRNQGNNTDQLYAQLWTQYLRVRCILYRHLVADPAEAGLSSFSERYHRIDEYVDAGFEALAPSFAMDEPELDLKAVEVRSAPPRNAGICRGKAADIERVRQWHNVECGWVFHLIRDRGHTAEVPRYAAIYRSHERAAALLARCLETWPALLHTIRGLDLASQELKGPLWLAIPSLLHLRHISRQSARQQPGLQPLRLTLHVGEDFRHLASGLRTIHEPFIWKVLERGDRLGHALALGIDAAEWCQQHPRILQPRWERILDLAWILAFFLSPGQSIPDGINLYRLQRELGEQLRRWSGIQECEWEDGLELHQRLGEPSALTEIDYPLLNPQPPPPTSARATRLLWVFLYERARQAYADEIIEIPTEPDAPLLTHIQQRLAVLLAQWQMTIEINPTSNLLIGALKQPLDQPMFHLRPVGRDIAHALPIAISADDPITFATRLADEYAYAWAGMVVGGRVAPTYARQWLDETVETAWRSRFTTPIRRAESQ